MKVLYLSYDGMTDFLGQSQVIPYLTGLSRLGHDIHVISCEKKASLIRNGSKVEKLLQDADIGWSYIPFSSNPPGLAKFIDLFRLRRAAIRQYKLTDFDLVHCRSYVAAFAGYHLKIKYGVRFLFDIRGFWVDERVEGGIWNLKNPLYKIAYRYFKRKERQFFAHADGIVSLTYKASNIISRNFGKAASAKTMVIPCCADCQLFSPDSIPKDLKMQLRHGLGIGDAEIVLTYLGSTGTWYKTREMLMFFSRFLRQYPDAKFLFITGDAPQKIQELAVEHGIDPMLLRIEKVERSMVPAYLSLSDLGVFFIQPSFSKQASSPVKMAELLCMGIPFISNTGVGDMEILITDNSLGLLVKDFSTSEYDRVIRKIPDLLQANPKQRRLFAESYLGLEAGVHLYHSVYLKIMD